MQRIVLWIAVAVWIAVLGGVVFLVYKFRWVYEEFRYRPAMPEEIKTARVVTRSGQFSKKIFYREPDLGLITDLHQKLNHGLMIVGQKGATLLTEDGVVRKEVDFDFEDCNSEMVAVEWEKGGFLCRGNWNTKVVLLDSEGHTLWSYGGEHPGIDDAVAGTLGKDGLKGVVVGFNGRGGVRLLSEEGKELWRYDEGDVWHVAITEDEKIGNVIVHSNGRWELTVRDASGSIVGRNKPDIHHFGQFSLTAWRDDPHRNKLVAADGDFVHVMSMQGETINRLPVPGNAGVAHPKGTPVHFSKNRPYFAALLRHFAWTRSLLYIYDEENHLVYDEVLDQDCEALLAVAEKNGAESLLLGCDGVVWKYSQVKKKP